MKYAFFGHRQKRMTPSDPKDTNPQRGTAHHHRNHISPERMCSSQLDSPLNERRGPPRKEAELEVKLILGSSFRGWTIAENFIAEKNARTPI